MYELISNTTFTNFDTKNKIKSNNILSVVVSFVKE